MAIINFAQGEFLMFATFLYLAMFSMSLRLGLHVSCPIEGSRQEERSGARGSPKARDTSFCGGEQMRSHLPARAGCRAR